MKSGVVKGMKVIKMIRARELEVVERISAADLTFENSNTLIASSQVDLKIEKASLEVAGKLPLSLLYISLSLSFSQHSKSSNTTLCALCLLLLITDISA